MSKTTKTTRINVLLAPEDKAKMEAAASSMGLSLSAWVRLTLLAAAKVKK